MEEWLRVFQHLQPSAFLKKKISLFAYKINQRSNLVSQNDLPNLHHLHQNHLEAYVNASSQIPDDQDRVSEGGAP